MSRCNLLTKYQILIYPDRAGDCCALRFRRIVPRIFFGLLFGLMITAGVLTYRIMDVKDMHIHYAASEAERIQLRQQILGEASELAKLRGQYAQVENFNHKLKVMLNMVEPQPEVDLAQGGPWLDFGRNDITPYSMRSLVRNMQRGANSLQSDIMQAERVQQTVLQEMRRNTTKLAWTPSVWPVKGRVTSYFGMRNHPFDKQSRMHQGLDIVPKTGRGTPVHAPANGVVTFAARKGYYGITLMIRHQGGVETKYAHLSKIAVKVGDTVSRDDVVAYVGNTGRSTGPHLHYEVRLHGKATNPKRYILN